MNDSKLGLSVTYQSDALILTNALRDCMQQYSQEEHPEVIAALGELTLRKHITDPEFISRIERFGFDMNYPFIHIKNLFDINSLPPTPVDDSVPDPASWRHVAGILLGILKIAGYQSGSFLDEMGGRLSHMVMPANNSEKSLVRSTKALHFHTEIVNGFFAEDYPVETPLVSPEVFGLACIRNPACVGTTVLPLSILLEQMSANLKTTLFRKIYKSSSQSSFDCNHEIEHVSVLSKLRNGMTGIRYSNSKLQSAHSDGTAALEELKELIISCGYSGSVILEPGDVLIINNRICLHGRDGITQKANFDGNDRWLIRNYGFSAEDRSVMKKHAERHHVFLV